MIQVHVWNHSWDNKLPEERPVCRTQPANKYKLRRSGLCYSRCVQTLDGRPLAQPEFEYGLRIRVGYDQAAPPELDFKDIHFSTNRQPHRGLHDENPFQC